MGGATRTILLPFKEKQSRLVKDIRNILFTIFYRLETLGAHAVMSQFQALGGGRDRVLSG